MTLTTPFPPNSNAAYAERVAPQGKIVVSAQYVAGVGFATVIETPEGKLLEARYPITNAGDVKEITREDFEGRYQQPIEPLNPKFSYMQTIRENGSNSVYVVLGCPVDNFIVNETLEAAYILVDAPINAKDDIDFKPKKIISQKKVERAGAFTLVKEKVGRGMNPTIFHVDDDCSGDGKTIDKIIADLNNSGHYPLGTSIMTQVDMDSVCSPGIAAGRTQISVKLDENDPDPAATMEELVNAGRQSVNEVATQVKARGMGAPIFHIDDDCSGNGKPVSELIAEVTDPANQARLKDDLKNLLVDRLPDNIKAVLQPIVADDQSAY